jgi:fucose permease
MTTATPTSDQRPGERPIGGYLLGFAVVGMVLTATGPALSYLRAHVHTTDGGIALVFVAQGIGYVVASLVAGRWIDHGHGHRLWFVGLPVAVAALALAGWAPNLPLLAIDLAVLGAAGGLCSTSANAMVMWSRPTGAGAGLNQLHLCFALGDLATPVLMNRSLAWTGGTWGMSIPVAAVSAGVWVMLRRGVPPERTARTEHEHEDSTRMVSGGLIAVAVFLSLYVALESGFTGWVHTFVEDLGRGSTTATATLTVFWVGFVAGRAVSSWAARTIAPGVMVACGIGATATATLVLLLARHGGPLLYVATLLLAIGVSPIYASMVAFAESRLRFTGRSASLLLGGAGIGGLALPWVMGQIFDHTGSKALPVVMVVMAVLLLAAAAVVRVVIPPAAKG